MAQPQSIRFEEEAMTAKRRKILVVDDDAGMREAFDILLRDWGYEVKLAADAREGQTLVEKFSPDIVISDVVMPEMSGLELLRVLKAGNPTRPVILVTAQATIDTAVEAMKHGAQDFITKPMNYTKLRAVLEHVERDIDLRRKARALSERAEAGLGAFIGTSRLMRELYTLIEDVSASQASVIITGESGTGKEVAARTIHSLGSRSSRAFIALNAAAIPETLIESELFGHERGAFTGAVGMRQGCFELANGGTLFLDEIAEMPVPLQPKLLRVLEDGRVRRLGGQSELSFDVRMIAATNRDPQQAVDEGKLRADLYYRLNVFSLTLPPLRDRAEDIPLLSQHFINEFNTKHRMSVEGAAEDTLDLLKTYNWPGNVRELRNVMERAVIVAKDAWIEPRHLPPYLRDSGAGAQSRLVVAVGNTTLDAVEKELILKTLEASGNNKAEAARQLGIDVKTIRNKLKTWELE